MFWILFKLSDLIVLLLPLFATRIMFATVGGIFWIPDFVMAQKSFPVAGEVEKTSPTWSPSRLAVGCEPLLSITGGVSGATSGIALSRPLEICRPFEYRPRAVVTVFVLRSTSARTTSGFG